MNDMRDKMDIVAKGMLGHGFANKNEGLGDAPAVGFEPNPAADPADIARAWAEVVKRMTPGDWKAISTAAGVPADMIRPRSGSDDK